MPAVFHRMGAGIRSIPHALAGDDDNDDDHRGAIRSINLHCNEIDRIDGLDAFATSLRQLNLSSNRIERIDGLQALASLEYLNLSSNRIRVVAGLDGLHRLTVLLLSYNPIVSVVGLAPGAFQPGAPRLHTLDLRDNAIESLDQIDLLVGCRALRALTLASDATGNAVCKQAGYASRVGAVLPWLSTLDGAVPSAIVPTPRIDTVLNTFRSRKQQQQARPSPGAALAILDQALQEARLESIESKLERVLATAAPPAAVEHRDADAQVGETTTTTATASTWTEVEEGPVLVNASTMTDPDREVGDRIRALQAQVEAARAFVHEQAGAHDTVLRQTEEHCLALQRAVDEARREQGDLTRRLSQLESERDALAGQVERAGRDVEALHAEQARLTSLVDQATAAKAAAIVQVEDLEKRVRDDAAAKGDLVAQVQALSGEVDRLRSANDLSSKTIETIRARAAENDAEQGRTATAMAARCADVETHCRRLARDRAALKEIARDALQKQRRACRQLDEALARQAELSEAVGHLQSEARDAQAERDRAQRDASRLEKELAAANAIVEEQRAQLVAFSERMASVEDSFREVEAERRRASDQDKVRAKVAEDQAAHVQQLKAALAALEKEKREWAAVQDQLSSRVRDYADRCHEAERALDDCQATLQDVEQARAEEMAASERDAKRVQDDLAERDRIVRYVEQELDDVRKAYAMKVGEFDEQNAQRNAELAGARAQAQAQEAALADTRAALALARQEAARQQALAEQAAARASRTETEMRALLGEMERKRREALRLARSWSTGDKVS
ncbi:unnamed protein product (mitochondrion) [Plasmodiophora brassicae]|uniref:U2A'/phosphoprotein 32 family A C-terminal domain-containing protein n=1 Tax=Plasmodiophora brassicae TaxID=37360 RepID=A0A3P3YDN4_PLABS|nr:unnamed protein product [Plasmodiophora brassicae]